MKPGDLVQVRAGFAAAGALGIVLGPAAPAPAALGGLDVLFNDGVFAVHPSSLKLVRGGKACNRPTTVV
jgi:hypothetical protein